MDRKNREMRHHLSLQEATALNNYWHHLLEYESPGRPDVLFACGRIALLDYRFQFQEYPELQGRYTLSNIDIIEEMEKRGHYESATDLREFFNIPRTPLRIPDISAFRADQIEVLVALARVFLFPGTRPSQERNEVTLAVLIAECLNGSAPRINSALFGALECCNWHSLWRLITEKAQYVNTESSPYRWYYRAQSLGWIIEEKVQGRHPGDRGDASREEMLGEVVSYYCEDSWNIVVRVFSYVYELSNLMDHQLELEALSRQRERRVMSATLSHKMKIPWLQE